MRRPAAWILLALGAALRLGLYLSRPSLSIDETMASLQIGARSFAGLLHVLDYAQTAPPLFLWMVKLCALIGGVNEYALRALPLGAGIALPWLLWRVAARLVDASTATLAVAFVAFAPTLVQFSVIVKPYMSDAAIALVLIDRTLVLLERPEAFARWAWLGIAGFLATLGSAPAPFWLAGVAAAIVFGVRPFGMTAAARLAVWLVVWSGASLAVYVGLYRPVAASAYMQSFWGASFFTPGSLSGWTVAGRAFVQALAARPIPPSLIAPFALVALIGFRGLTRAAGPARAALLVVPILAICAASLLHRYPLAARLLVGVAPTLALALAVGLLRLAGARPAPRRALAVVVVVALASINLLHPYRTPALRPAIRVLRAAGDAAPIYVSSGAIPAWAFNTTDWASPDTAYLDLVRRWAGDPEALGFHNRAPRGGTGVTAPAAEDGATVHRAGRLEILGLAPGIQWREVSGLSGRVPDPGWAATEAARIEQAGPAVRLLVATAYAGSRDSLVAALARAGGRLDGDTVIGGVERSWVRFAGSP